MAHEESPGTRMEMSPAAAPEAAPPTDSTARDDADRRHARDDEVGPIHSTLDVGRGDLLGLHATCAIEWRADGYEAIRVFVDPALTDRADGLCAAIEGWSFVHRRLDDLSTEITQYADREGMSVAIDPRSKGDPYAGLVAIAITPG